MSNHGCFIGSLGLSCKYLAAKAEALGIEIYPGFAAAEILYGPNGEVHGIATGDMGIGKERRAQSRLSPAAWSCARNTLCSPKARAATLTQDPAREIRSLRRKRQSEIRHRAEGNLAGRSGETQDGPDAAQFRLAALDRDQRRIVSLSLRRQSGVGRIRRASQLRKSVSVAVRGIPALQDASGDPRHLRGRQTHRLWRARDDAGRIPVGAEACFPRRRADRLRGRLRQRAAHQGHA